MDEERIQLTEEGLALLKAEYEKLVHVDREEYKDELAEARSLGDLSENADYDAARDRQAKVEARIQELEYQLSHYDLIDTSELDDTHVHMGSIVKYRCLDTNEVCEYKIVGSTETDPLNGTISNISPVGEALMDAKKGDVVKVRVKKPYEIKVLKVSI